MMRGPRWFGIVIVAVATAVGSGGCITSYWTYSAAGGGKEAVGGEEHDVPYSIKDTFVMTQDVLRGEGVLFEVNEDYHLTTLWRDADVQAGILGGLVGVHPRYRYEIEVVQLGPRQSRIIVNVRAEEISDADLPQYQVDRRLDLFNKFDQLAAKFPPPTTAPTEGGVNYALLPDEDLKGLAKRVTGNEDNWHQIAKDNGLTSPVQPSGVRSVWIRNTLLEQNGKAGAGKGGKLR